MRLENQIETQELGGGGVQQKLEDVKGGFTQAVKCFSQIQTTRPPEVQDLVPVSKWSSRMLPEGEPRAKGSRSGTRN